MHIKSLIPVFSLMAILLLASSSSIRSIALTSTASATTPNEVWTTNLPLGLPVSGIRVDNIQLTYEVQYANRAPHPPVSPVYDQNGSALGQPPTQAGYQWMFFKLDVTNVGNLTMAVNPQMTYNVTLVFSGPTRVTNLLMIQSRGLLPGQEMIQRATLPIPQNSELVSVAITQSGLQISSQVSHPDTSTWFSNMQAPPTPPTGWSFLVWGGAPNPYSNSYGTTFYSYGKWSSNNYNSGDQYITSQKNWLASPGDGFLIDLYVYKYQINQPGLYFQMVAFVSDQCPASNTDDEYGFVFDSKDASNALTAYYQAWGGQWYADTVPSFAPLTQMQTYIATIDTNGGLVDFSENGYGLPAVQFSGMGPTDCMTVGFNSGDVQLSYGDPGWYMVTNAVSLFIA
jgi:hypothetical protein